MIWLFLRDSLRARDRGLGHGHGDSSQHSKLKLTTSFYPSLLHFYYRGYETRIQGDSYIYEFRGQPSLGGHQVNYCHSYYSCNVRQDRVMGGRECRDFISLWPRVKSRDLSVQHSVFYSDIVVISAAGASSDQWRQAKAANQSWALGRLYTNFSVTIHSFP